LSEVVDGGAAFAKGKAETEEFGPPGLLRAAETG
jgi:hypothetical protein